MKQIIHIILLFNLLFAIDTVHIYISADRTGAKESGLSIERGVKTALATVNNRVGSLYIKPIILDHRGSTPRFTQHIEQYLKDDKALLIVGGLHSPPLLSQRNFINENNVLTLVPWAAAGPITRYPSKDNWIFRLSVDDTKAGVLIGNYAISEGFKKPVLLLEETGWGRSNEKTMTAALKNQDISPLKTEWFNWNIGINQAKVLLRSLKQSGADVIFFVGNAPEGKSFARAMTKLEPEERLPIRSHWGITGGDFPEVITRDLRDSMDLLFIQSSFSFIEDTLSEFANSVLESAQFLFASEIQDARDISAPAGFIHSYDLTLLLLQAMKESHYGNGIIEYRKNVRTQLETINEPVEGLIKTYRSPFGQWSKDTPDAHEALGIDDWEMAYYFTDNSIRLLKEKR